MTEIKLTEKEKKVFENTLKTYPHSIRYLLDEGVDHEQIRLEILQIFYSRVLQLIKSNPGILQRRLYEGFFGGKNYKNYLRDFLYLSEKKGIIIRIKSGSTYKLYFKSDITKGDFLKKWRKAGSYPFTAGMVSIERYNVVDEVIEYFGKNILEKLYQSWYDETGDIRDESETLIDFLYKVCKDSATLKLDMNKPLIKIINKYWDEECDIRLKEFLSKYGFFADKAFISLKLEELIGKRNFSKFEHDLKRNASSFKIKWHGGELCHSRMPVTKIPYLYAESLKYRWGIKPKIIIKKCRYCGREFIPILPNPYRRKIENVVKYYPIKKSINEINFCCIHFPPLLSWEKDSPRYFKKLIDLIGFIPPSSFHEDYSYLKELSRQEFEKSIVYLNHLPSYSIVGRGTPRRLNEKYSSWIEFLISVGILKREDILKTPRGYMCISNDGHICRSIGEKNIDDWLYREGIPHEKEVRYPGKRAFRTDWKVGKYFIEFWGLKGQEDYDEKMEIKKKLARENNIPLIGITQADIPFLGVKLKKLKDEFGGQELPIHEMKLSENGGRYNLLEKLDERSIDLMKIRGMGYTRIKKLNEAGIYSLEDVKHCSFSKLLSIEGLGDKLIKELLTLVGREEECYLLELKKIPMVWNETLVKLDKAGIKSMKQLSECDTEVLVRTTGIQIYIANNIKKYADSLSEKKK